MNNLMNIDERLLNHQARIARVERDGWLLEAAKSSPTAGRESKPRLGIRSGERSVTRWSIAANGFKGRPMPNRPLPPRSTGNSPPADGQHYRSWNGNSPAFANRISSSFAARISA